MTTQTRTRAATTTTTTSRVEAVLTFFTADLVAFIANDLMKREVAVDWLRDLNDVLVFEAVERFQVKATFPSGKEIGLDYEVSDDGSIKNTDASGGFSTSGIPAGSKLGLVVRWRPKAPGLEKARELLRARGWGVGTMLEATGPADRAYSDSGYGVYRRFAGEWP